MLYQYIDKFNSKIISIERLDDYFCSNEKNSNRIITQKKIVTCQY